MDKNTLSNYGWIVVAILILSVMIALATPFGNYIQKGAQNTLNGLIDVNNEAIDLDNFYGDNWEYSVLKDYHGGLFVPNTNNFVLLDTEDGKVEANWYNLVIYDFLKFEDGVLANGSRVSEMEGELRISKEVSSIVSSRYKDPSLFLYQSKISSIVLLEGITEIGDWAFSRMPKLTSITLPASLEKIGNGILTRAVNLSTITVNENNEHFTVIDGVLYTKDKKELVKYPNAKMDEEYRIIDECETVRAYSFSFANTNGLKNVYFGENITNVQQQAFEKTGIRNIYINEKCNNIMWGWIRNTPNVVIHLNENNKAFKVIDNVLYNYEMTELNSSGYQADDKIIVPDGVTKIGILCNNASDITIPSSVTKIDEASFICANDGNGIAIVFNGTKEQWENIDMGYLTEDVKDSNIYILSISTITFLK